MWRMCHECVMSKWDDRWRQVDKYMDQTTRLLPCLSLKNVVIRFLECVKLKVNGSNFWSWWTAELVSPAVGFATAEPVGPGGNGLKACGQLEKGRLETGGHGMSKNSCPEMHQIVPRKKRWSRPCCGFSQIPIFIIFHPGDLQSFECPNRTQVNWVVSIPSCRNDTAGTSVSWCWSSLELGELLRSKQM